MRPVQKNCEPVLRLVLLTAALVAFICMNTKPAHAATLQLNSFNPASGTDLDENSVTVTFSTNCSPSGGDDAYCKWSLTQSSPSFMENDCSVTGGANHTCNVTGMESGAEVVYFGCFTIMGQCAAFAGQTSKTYNVPSSDPPVQSAWSPPIGANLTTNSPVVTLATDVNADCRWSLSDQAYADMAGDCTGDGGMSHTCATSGLAEGANTVSIACRSEDLVEDDATTNDDLTYTVDTSSPDVTPPVQSGWNPGASDTITSTEPAVTFTTNEAADCRWSLTDQAYGDMAGDCTGDGTTNQTCATTGLPQGAVAVSIACRDVNNNQDTAGSNTDLALTVDSIQPVPGSWNPAHGSTLTTSSPTVTFTTNENADCKWSLTDQAYGDMAGDCTGDGGTAISCAVTGLSEGANTVSIACQDTLGNQDTVATNDDLSYTLDTTPPAPSSFNPPSGGGALASFNLTFSTDENADCKWSLTDQAYGDMAGDCTGDGGTAHTCAISGFVGGLNTMSVACRDTAGNEDTAMTNEDLSYTLDETSPTADSFNPAGGSTITTTSPTITFNTNENADCRWSLTDQAYGDMAGDCTGDGGTSHSCATSGLSQGANTVSVACQDTAGNKNTAGNNNDLSYTVDSQPPAADTFNPADAATVITAAFNVTFNTSENADCRWSLSDQAYGDMAGDCTGDGGASHTCAVSGLSEGANTVSTACRDTAGNEDTAGTNDDLSYTLDSTPPSADSFLPAAGATVGATSFNVTFNTGENADCRWSLSDQAYGDMAGDCTGDGGTSHTCAVSGLAMGANTVSTACRDTAGNEDTAGTNNDLAYTVVYDASPPEKSNFSPASGSYLTTGAIITLTTDEAAYCRWAFNDVAYDAMGGDCTGDGGTSHSCAMPTLSNGALAIYVGCADIAGNQDSAGSNKDLNYTVDKTPPTRPNDLKDGTEGNNEWFDRDVDVLLGGPHSKLYANWQPSFDNESGIAKYYCAHGTKADASDITEWNSIVISGDPVCGLLGLSLESGTTYYISVKAENAAGLQSSVVTTDGVLYAYTNLCGDVNKDGRLRSSDLVLLERHVAGTLSPALTAEQQYIADIADRYSENDTPDGVLDAADIQLLADVIIGKMSTSRLVCPAKP